jgi:surface carbohydrate biosynthesis protein
MKPHLILPVETAARELDAKLLLALVAVHDGFEVTLGNKALLNLRIGALRPGIYLSHNFNAGRNRIIGLARKLGHRVAAWDEEGLVWINEEIYRKRRAHVEAMRQLDLMLLWGGEQHRALQPALKDVSARVADVGNPRADLLRPELRELLRPSVHELRQRFGDFILFNSNFGWINHALAAGAAADVDGHLRRIASKSGFPLGYLQHRHRICQLIREAIPQIADRFPHRTIVIRPHPSENREAWTTAGQGRANVVVQYDDDLVAWLMAAGHIIHNGCTTAVETALLGRAAISYRPVIDAQHEIPQPQRVSHEARTLPELMRLLSLSELTDTVPQEFATHLADMVVGRGGDLSCTRVVREFRDMLAADDKPVNAVMRAMAKGAAAVRHVEKRLLRHVPGNSSQMHYVSQKFPAMTVVVVQKRLAPFATALGLEMPVVTRISDRVFRLRNAT